MKLKTNIKARISSPNLGEVSVSRLTEGYSCFKLFLLLIVLSLFSCQEETSAVFEPRRKQIFCYEHSLLKGEQKSVFYPQQLLLQEEGALNTNIFFPYYMY